MHVHCLAYFKGACQLSVIVLLLVNKLNSDFNNDFFGSVVEIDIGKR
jgi:hypothetical protein